jgi:itaconate CoA-transferase
VSGVPDAPRTGANRLPLDGLLVVGIEQAVAAPLATRQLADLGARVIKLERPGDGDFARHYDHSVGGVSAYFAWLNRGKESVTVDLKSPEGLELVARLVARADVWVQNLAPGAAERLGLDARTLTARHERLIACDLSGYGRGGPYGERKAYDLLIQAETGLVSITGTPDDPAKAGISVADISGGMYAFSGILAALYERERTGHGTTLDVSLFDGLVEWMGQPWYQARYTGSPPARTGARHASIAPYGPFRTGTGTIVVGLQNEREWRLFCHDVLLQPRLADDERYSANARRVEHADELAELIEAVFAGLTTEQVEARLLDAGIAFATERSPGELSDHPQLAARDRWRVVDSPGGPIDALLPPFSLGDREPRMGAVPALGEHTAAVTAWLDGD